MNTFREYEKIETILERDYKTKKLIEGKFRNETIEFLKDVDWIFTEKIDGTNIRVYWDGHKVKFFGRTEKAEIPKELLTRLENLFGGLVNEEMLEQKFGSSEVMLIGEGYGPKIQNGGSYRNDVDFILFDVIINGNYQPRSSVEDIASFFGIDSVPIIMEGNLQKGIDFVKTKPKSTIGKANMEGLIARPRLELKDRIGNRIIVKIKVEDFS